jgi:DNA modification methylase/predicted RNA-binding Zn-ribbon protein involved in translation (DUF1610 family)
MFEKSGQSKVTVLGIEFGSEDERRKYYREDLRKKLPELKKMEGFPIGTDDDIIALSDPPYYTACSNPWIADFVQEWESEKPTEQKPYHREPFAADVSEGKNDPIYNAHSYHTKVPHKAIMRYILHYTEPGDIVFDGFCGTGMTGVAAQLCGDRKAVESLGYRVDNNGNISAPETDETGRTTYTVFSRLGARHVVLNDLSPAATFIAYNYNTPVDADAFQRRAHNVLDAVQKECGWMYETHHTDGRIGTINYVIWSDVFVCPSCGAEVVFWDAALDRTTGDLRSEFACPRCGAMLNKRSAARATVAKYDSVIGQTISQAKGVPVLINYFAGGKRFDKKPDVSDLALLDRIDAQDIPYDFPTEKFMFKGERWGDTWRAGVHAGITNVHHFYTKRNLWVLSSLWHAFRDDPMGRLAMTSVLVKTASVLHNIGIKHGAINLAGALPNSMFIPSNRAERNLFKLIDGKLEDFARADFDRIVIRQPIATESLSSKFWGDSSKEQFDYVFIDPPFGSNLMYSELNFLWESWLRVWTNNKPEAIENKSQGKGLGEYRQLMVACLVQVYKVLKPGRWITVEFSNTEASIWNAVQTVISDAGFVIANVATLDKGQGTFNAQNNDVSVQKDLIISAYKPVSGMELPGTQGDDAEHNVWEFVRMHLEHLPGISRTGKELHADRERTPRALYDRLVAYYVARGVRVPMDSADFQQQARDRFPERDDMLFLDNQVATYDKAKLRAERVETEELFVSNEATAIGWLRRELGHERQTYSDIVGPYMKVAQSIAKHERIPELKVLLEQNFLQDDKGQWYVPDPHKESDLQKLRDKDLLKDFEQYRQEVTIGRKKLKDFRIEAMRAGFRQCWDDRAYGTIILMAEHLPTEVIEEDPQLLMYYDNAQTMKGA